MVAETEFKPIFDYSSAFKYESIINKKNSFEHSSRKSAFSYSIAIPEYGEKEETQEHWFFMFLRHTIVCVLYIIILCSFPISAWICIKKIHALERVVLMRLGKLQPIRGPGIIIILPFADVWTKVNLRPQIFTVLSSEMLTADGGIVEVKSDIEYQIANAVNYVVKLQNQEETLHDLGLHCLTNIVSERDQDDLESKRYLIGATLKEEMNHCVIKWGIEVTKVHIHPVKIIKAAEPVDAFGNLLKTLQSAISQSDHPDVAVCPILTDSPIKSAKTSQNQDPDVVESLKSLLRSAECKGLLKDVCASFKLEIVGSTTITIYCCYLNGKVSLHENDADLKPDLSMMMSEDNARAFLNKEISPLDAFMEGKVMVTGDWSLLRSLAKIFE